MVFSLLVIFHSDGFVNDGISLFDFFEVINLWWLDEFEILVTKDKPKRILIVVEVPKTVGW